MTDARCDLLIIGGGIVGLATAMECSSRFPGRRIVVLEKEHEVAAHQSSHNSGVIHSGLYYKPGSLKARMCVAGAAAMSQFCDEHGIPKRVCGKVVVATRQEELPALEELHRRGVANGVPNLTLIEQNQLREIEPHCAGLKALCVPGVAITDYGAVTRKYSELTTRMGGEVVTDAKVTRIARRNGEAIVETKHGVFATRLLLNCGGLHSDRLCKLAGSVTEAIIVPFRGEYYVLSPDRQQLVNGLIYPVPDPSFPFLGVHFTPKIHGGVEAGPNAVLALHREGYRKGEVNLADAISTLTFPGFWKMASKYWRSGLGEVYRSWNKNAFVRDARRLLPELEERDLQPGGAGVRAQALSNSGALLDDFHIVRAENVIHVLNVPSPAATASLAIARYIADLLPAI